MAENKLSWTELRRALASRAGVSEKDANTFLNALNAQLVEALKQDKQVKINGLGSFRLQAVAPRKSVNVTSGEQMTIEGYNKVVFVPEVGVKELVEKGGAVSGKPAAAVKQPTEIIDPLKKLGAQAEEIVDILGELGQSPKEKKPKAKPKTAKPEAEKVKEPQKAEKKPEVVEMVPPREKPKKKYHFVRDTLICVVVLLLVLLFAFFFLRQQLSSYIESLVNPEVRTEVVENTSTPSEEESVRKKVIIEAPKEVQEAPEIVQDVSEIVNEEPTETSAQPEEVHYVGWITTEPMHEASRLAWMSKRYYGSKVYWPYLYDANKDHISNPSVIATGTPIRVPKLTAAQMDTTLEQTRLTLERLRKEATEKTQY